jgi:hypothetical protein
MSLKFSNNLTIQDFKEFPIWEFTNKHESVSRDGELVVMPVTDFPVTTLEGRFIGTEVKLANGNLVWAVLLGINLAKAKPVSSAIFYRGAETYMLRCLAPGVSGPEQLAQFLGLRVEDVFPICFDISRLAIGAADAVKGELPLKLSPSSVGTRSKEYFKQLLKDRKPGS